MDTDTTRQRLALLGELGCRTDLIEALSSAVGLEIERSLWAYVHGPLVTHTSAWNSLLYEPGARWLPQRVRGDRIRLVLGQLDEDHIVPPSEIACVLHGASFDAPMRPQIVGIYLWACHWSIRQEFRHGERTVPDDVDVHDDDEVLRGRLRHEYRELARTIRRRVTDLGMKRTMKPADVKRWRELGAPPLRDDEIVAGDDLDVELPQHGGPRLSWEIPR